MGIAFKDLIASKEITFNDLNKKILVIDSFNLLYQFLTTIRGRDGSPLTDSNGNVTSHLVGLFSRTTKFMQYGIRPAFVFDGTPPKLKRKESERRSKLKKEAQKKYDEAVEKEDLVAMKKYGGRTTRLTPEIIDEAKKLITALGLPIIQAPSEGEAQAAFIVKNKGAYATVSQDYDTLLYESQHLVRNLSIAGKKKKLNALTYDTIKPEIIDLADVLNGLGIDNSQLIALAMLIGTDYNPGGIKGIGPKNALKLVKQHGSDFTTLFKEVKWQDFFDHPWEEVYDTFKKMPVNKDYMLRWEPPDPETLNRFLVDKHDFSEERVTSTLAKLSKETKAKQQRSLMDFG